MAAGPCSRAPSAIRGSLYPWRDSPPAEELSDERVAEVVCLGGATEVIYDTWVDTFSGHRSPGKQWTGRAFFLLPKGRY